MPANEFSLVMEKEMEEGQKHRHRLLKTQMETWSRHVTFKIWVLTTCSAGVFSIALLCIYQGRITEGLGLIGAGGLTATGSTIFKTLKGQ